MAANPISAPPPRSGASRSGWGVMWVLSTGLLAFLIISLIIRFVTPVPEYRLRIIEDIPLPGPLAYATPTSIIPDRLTPGQAARFDHFDFPALDPQTHLLFIAHSGPPADRAAAAGDKIDPATDGNIVVFDTQQRKVVQLVNVPQTTGMAVASDIGWVYASDANDSIIYGINEHTFQTVQIKLDPSDSPDAMSYDPVDHRLFVTDPGAPVDPKKTKNVDPANQNVAVIDVLTNKLITKIPIGVDHNLFPMEDGDAVGHIQYDITSHRVFVVALPQHDQDAPVVLVTPPSFIDVIDPTLPMPRVVSRINLPDSCVGPHGFVVDSAQEIGFVVCRETYKVLRVNLQTLQPFTVAPLLQLPPSTCDIARLDPTSHLLFIGCTVGIAIFNESPGKWVSWGYQFVGGSSNHTIAIEDVTQNGVTQIYLYVPLPTLGNRPVLRIVQYDPNGVEPGAGL